MADTDLPLNAWADKEGIEPPDLGLTSAPDQAAQELDELLNRVYIAGYQAGKKSGLTMVLAGDVILPEARAALLALMYRETLAVIGEDEILDTEQVGTGTRPNNNFLRHRNNFRAGQRKTAAQRYGQKGGAHE